MYLFTNFLLLIVIWWVIFFITLPINISVPEKVNRGFATSAPKKTYIGLKILITSAISFIIMLLLMFIKFDLGMLFNQ